MQEPNLYSVKGIAILDNDGNRIFAKVRFLFSFLTIVSVYWKNFLFPCLDVYCVFYGFAYHMRKGKYILTKISQARFEFHFLPTNKLTLSFYPKKIFFFVEMLMRISLIFLAVWFEIFVMFFHFVVPFTFSLVFFFGKKKNLEF